MKRNKRSQIVALRKRCYIRNGRPRYRPKPPPSLVCDVNIEYQRVFLSDSLPTGQGRNKAKAAVEELLRLRKSKEMLREKVLHLRDLIIDPSTPNWDVATLELKLQSAKESLLKTENRVKKKERTLGASSTDAV
jgi:hypothetical protein